MASVATNILQHIVASLRAAGPFALVTLGEPGSSSAVPRATLSFEGLEQFRSDDTPDTTWVRLRARVTVHTRSPSDSDLAARVIDLCDLAAAAILAEASRDGLCRDLPIGLSTEVDRVQPAPDVRRPAASAGFEVRCHYEISEE